MSRIERRLEQDRALRDKALELFKNDITVIKAEVEARGLGTRLADRLNEGAVDLLDDAVEFVQTHPGKVATGVTAAILLLARGPILRALGLCDEDTDDRDDEDA